MFFKFVTLLIHILRQFYHKRIIRFFFISGLNTAFGYGLFALLILIEVSYPFALLLSSFVGILFNFKTTGILVFGNYKNILIFNFFCVYGITYLFNLGGLALLKHFAINIYWANAVLLLPVGIFAYTLNKYFVFRGKRPENKI